MDEFIKQGHWWWLLIVPVATFVFALAGSWWGANLGKITEHKQWLRNQKQAAYQRFVRATQTNALTVHASLSGANSVEAFEQENQRMEAYWELNVIASEEVAEEAYRFIHEYKAYISLVKETNVVRQVIARRLASPEEEDSQEFLRGLEKYLDDKNLRSPTAIAVKGYQMLMLRSHLVVDAMRRDLGLPVMGEENASADPRNNPVENWLEDFRRTLPQGKFDSDLRTPEKADSTT